MNEISSKERLNEIIEVLKNNNILSEMTPEKLKNILEELGPTFIKIGQILSNRHDLLPEEYTDELSKLRSDALPMTYQEIINILSEEYNENLFNIFLTIDRNPIGSASIAQVHRAVLRTGETVVVKVQRKNIKETMISDIRLLKKATKILQIERVIKNVVSIEDVLDELLNTSLEEMDFREEANNIEEFFESNKNINYLKIPKVYRKLSNEKVLVLEYIKGISLNDKESLINNGYDLDEIGYKLADHYIYQAIDNGFFHADPHPDNIIIADGKITYIDFGMMGRLNNKNKKLLEKCIISIINGDVKNIERIILSIGTTSTEVDHQKLTKEIELILEKNKNTEIKDINISEFAKELLLILGHHKIRLPKDITMLIRGIIVLEGTLEVLTPSISLMEVLKKKAKEYSLREVFNKENITKEGINTYNSIKSLNKLPEDLHRLIEETSRGETKLNIEVSDSNKQIDRFEKMVHRIVVCVLDVAFIIGASLIVSNGVESEEQTFLFYLYVIIGTFFTIWLFIKMYIDKINRKK